MWLGIDFESPFFAWVGNIFAIIQIGTWFVLYIYTAFRFFKGTIFHSYVVEEQYASEKGADTPIGGTVKQGELRERDDYASSTVVTDRKQDIQVFA